MRRRLVRASGVCLTLLTLAACTPTAAPPTGTATPSAPQPRFTAATDLCERLDWSRLDAIDSTPTLKAGVVSEMTGGRSVGCNPHLDSTKRGPDVGILWVTASVYDDTALAEAAVGEIDFSGPGAVELAPWTRALLDGGAADAAFTGRVDNLVVKVSMTLDVDLAGVYGEEQLKEVVKGFAEDAYGLCRVGFS